MEQISILPVKPGTLNDDSKAALREVGVVVIEHENPTELRMLSPMTEVPASDMLRCAMKALVVGDNDYNKGILQRATFTKLMAELFDG